MNYYIFIPTYNEKTNLPVLLDKILDLPIKFNILIVDDKSPDGTGDIADEYHRKYPDRIYVIHREGNRGRGYAGITGFGQAIKLGADIIIEMDADLSHPVCYLPDFIKALDNADIVIGSRYIPGGKIEGWGWRRRLNSWVSRTLAKLVLGLAIKDTNSGYRAFRKEILISLAWSKFISPGPSILQEMLFHILKQNPQVRIKEIPITFIDRKYGQSKISPLVIIRWLIALIKIRCR